MATAASIEVLLSCNPGSTDLTTRRFIITPSRPMIIGRSSKNEDKNMRPALDNGYLTSPVISRKHAELSLSVEEGALRVYIQDLGSMHGTAINHETLIPGCKKRLLDGDMVKFGIDIFRDNGTIAQAVVGKYKLAANHSAEQFKAQLFRFGSKPVDLNQRALLESRSFAVPYLETDDEDHDEPTTSTLSLGELTGDHDTHGQGLAPPMPEIYIERVGKELRRSTTPSPSDSLSTFLVALEALPGSQSNPLQIIDDDPGRTTTDPEVKPDYFSSADSGDSDDSEDDSDQEGSDEDSDENSEGESEGDFEGDSEADDLQHIGYFTDDDDFQSGLGHDDTKFDMEQHEFKESSDISSNHSEMMEFSDDDEGSTCDPSPYEVSTDNFEDEPSVVIESPSYQVHLADILNPPTDSADAVPSAAKFKPASTEVPTYGEQQRNSMLVSSILAPPNEKASLKLELPYEEILSKDHNVIINPFELSNGPLHETWGLTNNTQPYDSNEVQHDLEQMPLKEMNYDESIEWKQRKDVFERLMAEPVVGDMQLVADSSLTQIAEGMQDDTYLQYPNRMLSTSYTVTSESVVPFERTLQPFVGDISPIGKPLRTSSEGFDNAIDPSHTFSAAGSEQLSIEDLPNTQDSASLLQSALDPLSDVALGPLQLSPSVSGAAQVTQSPTADDAELSAFGEEDLAQSPLGDVDDETLQFELSPEAHVTSINREPLSGVSNTTNHMVESLAEQHLDKGIELPGSNESPRVERASTSTLSSPDHDLGAQDVISFARSQLVDQQTVAGQDITKDIKRSKGGISIDDILEASSKPESGSLKRKAKLMSDNIEEDENLTKKLKAQGSVEVGPVAGAVPDQTGPRPRKRIRMDLVATAIGGIVLGGASVFGALLVMPDQYFA